MIRENFIKVLNSVTLFIYLFIYLFIQSHYLTSILHSIIVQIIEKEKKNTNLHRKLH